MRHHAVVRFGHAVAERHVVALIEPEIAERPGREDELAREAECIERFRTVFAAEGAERRIVLAQHQIGDIARTEIGIVLLRARLFHPLPIARPRFEFRQRVITGVELRIEEIVEAVGEFHQMGIGVVDEPVLDIGHGIPPDILCRNYTPNRASRNGARSKAGTRLCAISASISPIAAECLKPWPEQHEARMMRSDSGAWSMTKPMSGVVV